MKLHEAANELRSPYSSIERAVLDIDKVLEAMPDGDEQEELSNIATGVSNASFDLEQWIKEHEAKS